MSARTELAGILRQWLKLTREEGAAIASARWPVIKRIQARKTVLRESLATAARQCAREDAAGGHGQPDLKQFRAEAARIISLLTRNGEALAAPRRLAFLFLNDLARGTEYCQGIGSPDINC
jgi:hypothetical protein